MKAIKYIALGLLGLIVLLVVISFALPSSYRVERSIEINAPMETVYPLVYDPKSWASNSAKSSKPPT